MPTDLTTLTRSEIRYALYRCRSGGPDKKHKDVLKFFNADLKAFDMTISEFPDAWDVGINNPLELVSGHMLIPLKAKITDSLFNEDGTVKE